MSDDDRLRLNAGWVRAGVIAALVVLILILGWLAYAAISWEPAYPV